MDTVSVTVLLLVLYLGGISNYTQKGLGTMGAPFQQLGMFLFVHLNLYLLQEQAQPDIEPISQETNF